ncbi:MAG: hypothetical protein E7293_00735 [Lachnospiraceae bacterium]|nr:hypothetical protein [Lachnospiraceae bacterium]
MAKKFGKILLFTAVVGAAAAGAYYYFQKKSQKACEDALDGDEDYDNFSDSADDADACRSYIPLGKEECEEPADQAEENAEEKVEEFFGENTEA